MELFGQVLTELFSLYTLFLLVAGVSVGILGGILPGISNTMTVALVATVTFTMDPLSAVILLVAAQMGATYGGSITSTVLNIPGSPASAATVLEGYPMTKRGEGDKALSINAISSFFGNTTGALLLLLILPVFVVIAMNFLSYEMFWFAVFGIVICAQLAKADFVKGLMAGAVGLLLGTVGMDPIHGSLRLTMDVSALNAGISLIPAMVGLFGMAEVFNYLASSEFDALKVNKGKLFYWKEFWEHKWLALRVTVLGFIVGILPGVGPNIASWIGYDHAKTTSKDKETFGTGRVEGLIGSETSSNSCAAGAYAPLLAVGIPADNITAIVLGVLLVHGVQPGPTFIANNPIWVYMVVSSILMAGVLFLFIGTLLSKVLIRVITIPMPATMAIVTLLCIIGAFASNNRITDIYQMFIFGIVGWVMTKNGFPVPPLILGILLSNMIDSFFRRGLIASMGEYSIFFTRPISMVLIALLLLTCFRGFVSPVLKARKEKKKAAANQEKE